MLDDACLLRRTVPDVICASWGRVLYFTSGQRSARTGEESTGSDKHRWSTSRMRHLRHRWSFLFDLSRTSSGIYWSVVPYW
ncbi:hypothetical protein ANCCAN_30326 [Ancylostoma caninum]|uniref:Uncharacterized protein n=1 Tax=Ancylostoma caninum TaxID=29170 RepID=A0A368EWI2_ANCCA|nr:hypothetical protein ANCCAN_30326 [Ancylostoma caninum]